MEKIVLEGKLRDQWEYMESDQIFVGTTDLSRLLEDLIEEICPDTVEEKDGTFSGNEYDYYRETKAKYRITIEKLED